MRHPLELTKMNKTDAGNGSYGICRVIDESRSPSPDPKRSLKNMKTILSTLLLAFLSIVGSASAEVAKQLHMAVIDLNKTTFDQAPWLNSTHFLIVRSTDDPAFRWIEKITGKKLDERKNRVMRGKIGSVKDS